VIDINHLSGTYNFPIGIMGFEDVREYGISNFASVGGDVIGMVSKGYAFICVDPILIEPDYSIILNDDWKEFLKNTDEKDIAVICIVSIGTSDDVSANLAAPIVLDTKSKIGFQYVMKQKWENIRFKFDTLKIRGLQELINFKITKRKT